MSFDLLRNEVMIRLPEDQILLTRMFKAEGYRKAYGKPNVISRAYAFQAMLRGCEKTLYPHDRVAGSRKGAFGADPGEEARRMADGICGRYGERDFGTNSDHYAPNYSRFLARGITGTLEDIETSMAAHPDNDFLEAAKICMEAFREYVSDYAEAAKAAGMEEIAETCAAVAKRAPESFKEALQLMWLCHVVFVLEGRYAMALGRMDQFLYPFYIEDLESGAIAREDAVDLVACCLYKILEQPGDVVNIAIGGVNADGEDAVNELSYVLLDAVRACNVPGPNLSARISSKTPDAFLDECLKLIGTGLGYPALMNDEVNMAALARLGYKTEDVRNYCMVGCIENLIQGKQPPWSDGRFNSPKYLELAMNNGVDMLTGVKVGVETGEAETLRTMDEFMAALEAQLRFGAAEYVDVFQCHNDRFNPEKYMQPFLSCFCDDCIARGKDINDGGAIYPSVHGAACMGIGTLTDCLYAVEETVYNRGVFTLAQLRDMMRCNFEGHEAERQMLLKLPKYGNDVPEVDKYAKWYVKFHSDMFDAYRTRDGGYYYIGIAANTQNISAGALIAATPDGRLAREPLSDAASPMHGMDKHGPTAVVNSITVPDYKTVSCGSVVNQKYSPVVFTDDDKRAKLRALIRVYFAKGGQEMQINSVSREMLKDAMERPDGYESLVVRVSGFSAFYTQLDRAVQEDILKRTEHNG